MLEDGARLDVEVHELRGAAPVGAVEVGRGLGREVKRGAGPAIDVDATPIAVDEAVAELLDEYEGHLRQVRVEVDRPIYVQRRALVLALDPRRATQAGK